MGNEQLQRTDADDSSLANRRRPTVDNETDTSANRESTTWLERDGDKDGDKDGDDDVIKVDTVETFTPNERAAGILSRMTQADARLARSELRAKRFVARIEQEFRNFCMAYGLADSKVARTQFVAFLGQAGLGKTRAINTVAQSSNAAKSVFFEDVAAGTKVTLDTVGARDVFDPRVPLTDEERDKLRGLTIDGKNALVMREAAEKEWETKQYSTVIDAKAVYATGSPHLAAFEMAARNAGYSSAEIAMAAEGKDEEWLWHYTREGLIAPGQSKYAAMPATLKAFQDAYGTSPMQVYRVDCNRLEDARMAIAAGQTLAQFYADPDRGEQYFQAPDREMKQPSLADQLPDPRKLKTWPLGFCSAGSATLGVATVGYIYCSTNNKYYISGGFTTALGIALSGQRLVVWGVEGATLESVITGPSTGAEFSIGEGVSIGGVLFANSSGVMAGASGNLGVTLPAGINFSETYDIQSGKVPLISSTYEAVSGGLTELTFGGVGRGKVLDTVAKWPMTNAYGHGFYNYLTGVADSNLHSFTLYLPAPLEKAWNASAEQQAIKDLIAAHGGEQAISRGKTWGQLVPEMKALTLQFYEREVKNYVAR